MGWDGWWGMVNGEWRGVLSDDVSGLHTASSSSNALSSCAFSDGAHTEEDRGFEPT